MQMNDIQKALDKTKVALMQKPDSMFFTTLVFSLRFLWDDSQPTAYTNGKVMGWNQGWFMSLPQDQRVGVMVHEAMHVAYDHISKTRLGSRDPSTWNAACDHVINLQLLARGFQLPPGLHDPKYANLSAEQVYDLLVEEQQNQQPQNGAGDPNGNGSSNDPGSGNNPLGGDIRHDHGMTEQQLEQHVQDILVRAAVQSKMAGDKPGTIPGSIELFIDKLLNPKLPWQTILRRFVSAAAKDDYSFRRPNRRYLPDYYLPGLYSETIDEIVFAVDISGSVTDDQFKQYVSDIAKVMKSFKPKKITIVQFDHRIHSVTTVRSLLELKQMQFHGRGGTAIEPVFDWLRRKKPKLAMVFTDGEFHWPDDDKVADKLLWLINDNPDWKAPRGRTLHFDTD